METMTLDDLGEKTRMTTSSVFQAVADRDAMVASGMQLGAGRATTGSRRSSTA
jgi:hypothetical protein